MPSASIVSNRLAVGACPVISRKHDGHVICSGHAQNDTLWFAIALHPVH